ncbi:DNA-binding protein [Geobacter sulfurreducens]|nr:DNA-binding protein [Geobacter sulfurreducens]
MNTKRIGTLVALLLMVASATTAFAAPWKGWRGSGGWGAQGAYQRLYNPATVETMSGEVVAVERVTPLKGMGAGIHLQLRTDKETIPVHLGPAWYIERLDTRIEKGDTIEVKGSRVTIAGKPVIIAEEVKKGDALLKLRDESGIPAWAGWRR